MGMAASQARLLTLTARIHDVEYEAQALQNAKVQLSTQSDQVYQDYLDALDATTLTVLKMDEAGNESKVTATFNNLCSLNKVQTADENKSFALFDSRGRLIVDDDVYEAYDNYSSISKTGDYDNATCFAMYAMGVEISSTDSDDKKISGLFNSEEAVYESLIKDKSSDYILKTYYDNVVEILETLAEKYETVKTVNTPWDNNFIETNSEVSDEDKQLYENALLAFRTQLYKTAGEDIYKKATGKNDFDYSTFQYYVSIFRQIEQAGGCVAISEFNSGDSNSNAANNSEWLKAMISSGKITMANVTMDTKTSKVTFNATSPSSDSVISYTKTTEIDKTALAKAEAEYEHDMSDINKKDEKYDLELSKLETERTALTTEYESVKKVIQDNVERTFGIFS